MEIINGKEVVSGALLIAPNITHESTVYTDSQTVLLAQTGETLVMNSTSNKIFTLPSVGAGDVGVFFTFININTGRLTIQPADADIVADSSAGGTFYSDTDSYSQVTLELASTTKWIVRGAHGTWTST